jgi:hypothetical protein
MERLENISWRTNRESIHLREDAMAFDHAPLGLKEVGTPHRGRRYRSRLAAQWAAFLDAMRIAYVYEAETFALSPGVYFTPTFWLPQLRTWLEVRPAGEGRDADRAKIELFSIQHPETRMWITSEWHVEQLAEPARPIARGLLLADAGRPGDRVWVCGTNDEASEHLIFDSVDIGRPNHAPGFGGSRPADPNSDTLMRIAYAHAEQAGNGENEETWGSLGEFARRGALQARSREMMAGRGG